MSLSDILNDIQGSDISQPDVVLGIEAITVTQQNRRRELWSKESFDKDVVNKFNQLYQKLLTKKTIKDLGQVDKKIATEVFTMLNDVSPSTQAKITQQPSENNKKVVMDILGDIRDEVPQETIAMLRAFLDKTKPLFPEFDTLGQSIAGYSDLVNNQLKRLSSNPPIVVTPTDKYTQEVPFSYNLLTSSIQDFYYKKEIFVSTGYSKYDDDGALYQKLVNMTSNTASGCWTTFYEQYLGLVVYDTGGKGCSVCDISDSLNTLNLRVKTASIEITQYTSKIEEYLNTITGIEERPIPFTSDINELVNQMSVVTDTVIWLQGLMTILDDKCNPLDTLVDFLSFLD